MPQFPNIELASSILTCALHGFRRMADSYAMSNNVPLNVVKDMLGHSDIATTNIYLRRLQASQIEGAKVMSNTFDKLINDNEEK